MPKKVKSNNSNKSIKIGDYIEYPTNKRFYSKYRTRIRLLLSKRHKKKYEGF